MGKRFVGLALSLVIVLSLSGTVYAAGDIIVPPPGITQNPIANSAPIDFDFELELD